MRLKDAYINMVNLMPNSSVVKQSNKKPDDFFRLINSLNDGILIKAEDLIHLKEILEDKKIVKRYLSTEIKEDYKIFALALLGIEYLCMQSQEEDYCEAKQIFDKEIYLKTVKENND